jgi:hypothetical protein
MKARNLMTVDQLSLVIHSLRREWVQNPTSVMQVGQSMFFQNVQVFDTARKEIWITLNLEDFRCPRPGGLFKRKDKKTWDESFNIIQEIKSGVQIVDSVEELICRNIPAAKHIIAERVLVEDGD